MVKQGPFQESLIIRQIFLVLHRIKLPVLFQILRPDNKAKKLIMNPCDHLLRKPVDLVYLIQILGSLLKIRNRAFHRYFQEHQKYKISLHNHLSLLLFHLYLHLHLHLHLRFHRCSQINNPQIYQEVCSLIRSNHNRIRLKLQVKCLNRLNILAQMLMLILLLDWFRNQNYHLIAKMKLHNLKLIQMSLQ